MGHEKYSTSELKRIKEHDHGLASDKIARANKRRHEQALLQKSRGLIGSAESLILKFRQGIVFDFTDQINGEDVTKKILITYPDDHQKSPVDKMGRIKVQNTEGKYLFTIGLISFIEKTGIGKRSEDGKSIDPNYHSLNEYQNQGHQLNQRLIGKEIRQGHGYGIRSMRRTNIIF